jgi:hypothetical protein
MKPRRPDIDAIKNSLRTRYRQKIKDELPDNGLASLLLSLSMSYWNLRQKCLRSTIRLYEKVLETTKP